MIHIIQANIQLKNKLKLIRPGKTLSSPVELVKYKQRLAYKFRVSPARIALTFVEVIK